MEPRNLAIVAELNSGAAPSDVAKKYNLSESRIRGIRQEVKAWQAGESSANGNGRGGGTMAEIGVTGLKQWSGVVQEEFLADLNTASRRYTAYNEMRQNSPVVASSLQSIVLSIRRMEWRVEGGDETDDEEDERVMFVEECMGDMTHSWSDFMGEVMTMMPFGYAFFETVYKRRDDGKIGWRKFAFRGQHSLDRWEFDDKGGPQAFIQRTWPDWQQHRIPFTKGILFRTTREKNNPEGQSILRPAYVPYYYLKNLQAIEAIGIERDLAGLPIVYMGRNTDTGDGSPDHVKAQNIVKRVRNDEQAGVVVPNPKDDPDGWAFELMSSPGQKQYNVDTVITRYEKRIAMSMLAQFIMLGMDQVGSYSLSQDQSDFFVQAVEAFADIISETFTQFAIKPLLELNGFDLENMPRLEHGPLGKVNLDEMSKFFNLLGAMGFVQPDPELEQYLRGIVNAPELTEEQIEERQQQEEEDRQLKQQMAQGLQQANAANGAQNGRPGQPNENGEGGRNANMTIIPFAGPSEDTPPTPALRWGKESTAPPRGMDDPNVTERVIGEALDWLEKAGLDEDLINRVKDAELLRAA